MIRPSRDPLSVHDQTAIGIDGVETMGTGDVVILPPNVRHWHGATATTDMTHAAMARGDEKGRNPVWMEPVSEEDDLSQAE